MDLQDKILNLDFVKKVFSYDHLLHFFVGFILFFLLTLVVTCASALLIVAGISLIKELIIDLIIRNREMEVMDIIFTVLPGVLLTLKNIL